MIFSVEGHVEQTIDGIKTQTRRESDRYEVGKSYAVQRCRTCKSISEGRIVITSKRPERSYFIDGYGERIKLWIGKKDALAEGGYTPEEFEALYDEMHPNWITRVAYEFVFTKNSDKGGD